MCRKKLWVQKKSMSLDSKNVANGSIVQYIGTIPVRSTLARLTCDYNAISVQLQLQLPTGTELGNKNEPRKIFKEYNYLHSF